MSKLEDVLGPKDPKDTFEELDIIERTRIEGRKQGIDPDAIVEVKLTFLQLKYAYEALEVLNNSIKALKALDDPDTFPILSHVSKPLADAYNAEMNRQRGR